MQNGHHLPRKKTMALFWVPMTSRSVKAEPSARWLVKLGIGCSSFARPAYSGSRDSAAMKYHCPRAKRPIMAAQTKRVIVRALGIDHTTRDRPMVALMGKYQGVIKRLAWIS